MRLLACPGCHAQYDSDAIAAARFTCRCGAELENRPAAAKDAPVVRCGACGGALAAGEAHCSWCGSEVVRRALPGGPVCPECFARTPEGSRFCTACGVAFRPEPPPGDAQELGCPACAAPMAPLALAGLALASCGRCEGLWVPEGRLAQLLERAVDGALPPRVSGGNPSAQAVVYRRCPECAEPMQRRNFQRSSGVIVDVCRAHGTWLDADELERIAGHLRAPAPDAALVHGAGRGAAAREPRAAETEAHFTRILAEHRALPGARRPAEGSTAWLERLLGLRR